jgi:drug/metabolite transporter (DMT)-like permease
MGLLSLILSILAESSGKTLDKIIFRHTKTTPRLMTLITFIVMSAGISTYIIFTKQPFPDLPSAAIGLLVLVGLFSFGGNVFDVLSLKLDDLSLREPLVDFEPIVAGFIAYFLFPDQRHPIFLVAFTLGTFIAFWGIHRRKLRKYQKRGMAYMWVAVFLYSALPSIYQKALIYMPPAYLAFFRVTAILILVCLFFPPRKVRRVTSAKGIILTIVAGAIYAVGAVASLYAINTFGVVLTLLFLMLGPSLTYLFSYFILGEKVRRGEVLASALLATVVVLAAIIK